MRTLLQRYPRFTGGLFALATAGLVAAAVLVERVQTATRLRRELERNRQTVNGLRLKSPTAELLRQTSDELADASEDLARQCAAFRAQAARANVAQVPLPETTSAAFFDLVEFGERMRDRAREAGVRLSADERFGFAQHANIGPEPDLIAAVFRQRLIVEHLLDALWRARPDELLAVYCERPRAVHTVGDESDSPTRARDGTGSSVELEPGLSARQTGAIEAMAFRLEFVGHTPVLRRLLNSIADDEWPLSVRLVEVSPADSHERENGGLAEGAAPAFVRPRPMKFAVTIEFVEVPAPDVAKDPSA